MRIDLEPLIEAPITDPLWLVHDMIPRGSFVIIAGEHGVGKSMLGYHLTMTVTANLKFLGHDTVATNVLYFDEENSRPDSTRYWQRIWRGLDCPPVGLWAPRVRFEWFTLDHNWAGTMRRLVQEEPRPGLIIIDTATPALRIKDENDNAEASLKIQELRSIQHLANNDTTLVVFKHEKTRDDVAHRRTVRGAKTWLGAVDIVMYHSFARGGSGLRHTILEADKPRAFGLQYPIEIVPKWTQAEEPKGLVLNAQRAKRTEKK